MSLKSKMEKYIKLAPNGQVSVNNAEVYCRMLGRKVSNMERRLRESDKIVAIKNSKNHIIGYRWSE